MRLPELQHAFFAAVRSRGAPPVGLEELLTANERQTAHERLAVYHQAYWQRQVVALASTFPRLRSLLGQRFEPLMLRYLERWPSSSPCIEHIGAQVTAFLGEERAAALEREVARLEWASLRALLAPDWHQASLPRHLGATIVDCRLQFAPCLHVECVSERALAVLRAPADQAVQVSHEVPTGDAESPVWLAVFRRRFAVTHVQIAADEANALEHARRGDAFGSICEAFSALALDDAAARAASVLSSWFDRGWITQVATEGSPHATP